MERLIDENKKWMTTGAIGCTFATVFAKRPEKVGWVTVVNPKAFFIPNKCMLLSLQFPGMNIHYVKRWALENGFYEEQITENLTGLRMRIGDKIAWVQYFGPDSHVLTRQAPIPELMLCVRAAAFTYVKVAVGSILHLAHTSIAGISTRVCCINFGKPVTQTQPKN